jgi:hypothetical protein
MEWKTLAAERDGGVDGEAHEAQPAEAAKVASVCPVLKVWPPHHNISNDLL